MTDARIKRLADALWEAIGGPYIHTRQSPDLVLAEALASFLSCLAEDINEEIDSGFNTLTGILPDFLDNLAKARARTYQPGTVVSWKAGSAHGLGRVIGFNLETNRYEIRVLVGPGGRCSLSEEDLGRTVASFAGYIAVP